MKKLLTIIIVLSVSIFAFAETETSKISYMQQLGEKYVEEQAVFANERMQEVQQKLTDFPFTNRPSNAANIYISFTEGNDSNPGNDINLPWKTLDKLNNVEIYSGDRFFFKRGDEWRGEVIRENLDNVSFSDYGDEYDDKPVINGSVVISGWEEAYLTDQFGTPIPNVYVADLPTDYTNLVVKQLFANDERQILARFPDESYLDTDDIGMHIFDELTTNVLIDIEIIGGIVITNYTTNIVTEIYTNISTLIDYDLSDSPYYFPPNYWSNSTIFVKQYFWHNASFSIAFSNGITGADLPLKNYLGESYKNLKNKEYYIENNIHALDVDREWYYDKSNKKIYFCWEEGLSSLETLQIEVSVFSYGFSLKSSLEIKTENFSIKKHARDGINIYMDYGVHVKILSNDINNVYNNGIYCNKCFNTEVFGCEVNNSGETEYIFLLQQTT